MIMGDAAEMMRKYIPDGSIDVVTADVPYFLRVPDGESVTDYYLELNGEKPRFREDWDNFASINGVRRVL